MQCINSFSLGDGSIPREPGIPPHASVILGHAQALPCMRILTAFEDLLQVLDRFLFVSNPLLHVFDDLLDVPVLGRESGIHDTSGEHTTHRACNDECLSQVIRPS